MGERICKSPKEIKDVLDRYVIGQEQAKKALATAGFYQLRRECGVPLPKQTIFLAGESGCGKTYLLQILGKFLNLPIVIINAKMLTNPGYEGFEPGSALDLLYRTSICNVEKTEKGIVCVDEFDKLCIRMSPLQAYEKGIEFAFLRMIEGEKFDLKTLVLGNHTTAPVIDTKHILFIFSGSFRGLMEERSAGRHIVGFGNDDVKNDTYPSNITREDLMDFGFGREFVGRLTQIVTLETLGEKELLTILLEAKHNPLERYRNLFRRLGVILSITDDGLNEVVRNAVKMKIGARGLAAVINQTLATAMFEVPDSQIKEVIITAEAVRTGHCIYRDAGGMRVCG